MKAMVYRGPYKVRVEEKDLPRIEHPNDAIVRVQLAAICGSDLHLFGDAMNKGLTLRMNQCPVTRQWPRLFSHIQNGFIKPSEIVMHRIPLEHIAEGYHMFSAKLDNCIKPVIVAGAA